jgi:hypothetical protein
MVMGTKKEKKLLHATLLQCNEHIITFYAELNSFAVKDMMEQNQVNKMLLDFGFVLTAKVLSVKVVKRMNRERECLTV